MPKKRTKKQKARAVYHYAYPAGRSFVGVEQNDEKSSRVVTKKTVAEAEIYQYDPAFLKKDLFKTFAITSLMIAIEVGIFFWL